jgi:hypothetical protein
MVLSVHTVAEVDRRLGWEDFREKCLCLLQGATGSKRTFAAARPNVGSAVKHPFGHPNIALNEGP